MSDAITHPLPASRADRGTRSAAKPYWNPYLVGFLLARFKDHRVQPPSHFPD